MAIITIDGKEYDTDHLSQETVNNLNMIRMADGEIRRLQVELAIVQTARNAYAKAVQGLLPNDTAAHPKISMN